MSDVHAPLWCKSNFSFLEGASHAEELVEEAHRLGLPALGLADRDGVHGVVRAHVKARELGVQLLCGATMTVTGAALTASPVGEPIRVGLHAPSPDDLDDDGDAAPAVAPRRGRARRARGKPRTLVDPGIDPAVALTRSLRPAPPATSTI